MKPPVQLAQHHEIEAPRVDVRSFRQAWRVRSRLDQLLAAGSIWPAEWDAADQYRGLWGRLFTIAAPRDGSTGGGGNAEGRTVALLDLATRVLEIDRSIGPLAARLLVLVLVEDRSWAEVGRMTGRDPQTARAWAILAIRALAAHVCVETNPKKSRIGHA